jgi:sporulation protein YlmC with PRC-barrel domain
MTRNDTGARRRLSDLLGARVTTTDGRDIGHVNDVRLAPDEAVRGVRAELFVEGLVISDRHAGSMLGYDRRAEQAPWLVRVVVRQLHRNARYLPWSGVQQVSWEEHHVTVDVAVLEPLSKT